MSKYLIEQFAEELPGIEYGQLLERDWKLATACSTIASQYAEGFAEWIDNESWVMVEKGKWFKVDLGTRSEATTSQLRELYEETLKP